MWNCAECGYEINNTFEACWMCEDPDYTPGAPTPTAAFWAPAATICRYSGLDTPLKPRYPLAAITALQGHSEHEGNDAADERATWAQNGGAKNESNINGIMAYLRQQG
jgi:hypothetical protein